MSASTSAPNGNQALWTVSGVAPGTGARPALDAPGKGKPTLGPTVRSPAPQTGHGQLLELGLAAEHRWPKSAAELWKRLTATLPVESGVVRTLCCVLAVAYTGIVVVRLLHEGPLFLWPRGLVPVYAAFGAIAASRFTWRALRAYVVGLVVLLSLTTTYVVAALGFPSGDIALIAIATCVLLPFLLDVRDIVLADVLLLAGNRIILALQPPVAVGEFWTVLATAIAAGSAVGVLQIVYRSLTYEALVWWSQSIEREHTLRGFAENASASAARADLLDQLALRFSETVPGAGALFLAAGSSPGTHRVIASAGPGVPDAAALRSLAPLLSRLRARFESSPCALTHKDLHPDDRRALARVLPGAPQGVVVLPMRSCQGGMIMLFTPAAAVVTGERIAMWEAMASQAAVAAANLQAWGQLQQQEADARRVAEEYAQLAELRTRFISMTSHEFRTPITAIVAAADNLERYSDRMSRNERHNRLRKIKSQACAMTQLLNDLLVIGRADSGRLPYVPHPVDMRELCQEIVDAVRATTSTAHDIALHVDDVPSEIDADPKLLQQIVGNLLANAVKYSPVGGSVQLDLGCRNGAVVLRIRDEGIGIPPAELAELFQPFHRGSNVGNIPGSGLGLAIAKKAVDAHGGTITVDSTVGGGTTFEVTLPCTVAAHAEGPGTA